MDALGPAVGVASFGISTCQSLLSYYDNWKGYHTDISATYGHIADLAGTFTVLKASLADSTTNDESKARTGTSLDSCIEGLRRLQKRLAKLRKWSEPAGLRQKTWAEAQRAWYPFRASTLVKLKEDTSELRSNLSVALQVLQQAKITQGFTGAQEGIAELLSQQHAIDSRVQVILSDEQAAKRKIVVDWLSPPDPYYNHGIARKKHELGTGSWLFQSDEYKLWWLSEKAILCVIGKAGCGKSILCSTVVEEILQNCRSTPNIRCAFFYFSFSETDKQSYARCLSSLICQLSRTQEIMACVQQAYDDHYPNKLSIEALEDLFSKCVQQTGQTVLAIDAVDELPEGGVDGQLAVLDWLGRILQSNDRLRVFVTSRRLVEIENRLTSQGACCLLLDPDLANHDILTYVNTELETHYKLRGFDASVKERVKQVFAQKADGMFQWAVCQLDWLKSLKSTKPRYIEQVLHGLPLSLDATYERMLLQIDRMYHDEALQALRWLSFEMRPLTLAELTEACRIEYRTEHLVDTHDRGQLEDILDILSGLIVIEESDSDHRGGPPTRANGFVQGGMRNTGKTSIGSTPGNLKVRLAHFSIKEYLLSSRVASGKAATFALKEQDRQVVAQGCLAYMLYYGRSAVKGEGIQDLETFPLLKYASRAWTMFVSRDEMIAPAYEVQMLQNKHDREHWLAVYQPDRPWSKPFSNDQPGQLGCALYYTSLLGLLAASTFFLDHGADVNAQGGYLGSALQAAAYKGWRDIVELLLGRGADITSTSGRYRYALQAASAGGHTEVVSLLLNRYAQTDVWKESCGSALHAASERGHKKVVQLLIEKGRVVDIKERHANSALYAASVGGHQEVVTLLLDNGANFDVQSGYYGNALEASIRGNHPKIAKLFLDRGAMVNKGMLDAAIAGGHSEAVTLLLNNGADFDAGSEHYRNALETSMFRNHSNITKLLIDRSVMINKDSLDIVPAGGHHRAVEWLLDAGVHPDAQEEYLRDHLESAVRRNYVEMTLLLIHEVTKDRFETAIYDDALYVASERGHQEIAGSLLEAGANANARGRFNNSYKGNALEVALLAGHVKVVSVLLAAIADRGSGEDCNGSAIRLAFLNGRSDAVNVLMAAEIMANIAGDGLSEGPLQVASRYGHSGIVKMLLAAGANIDFSGYLYSGRALRAASKSGHLGMVRVLLAAIPESDLARCVHYISALEAVCTSPMEHLTVAALLLNTGADVYARSEEHEKFKTPLRDASENGHEGIVRLLLAAGADVNAWHEEKGNALQAACASYTERLGTVELLLRAGADVNAQPAQHGTALHIASKKGHPEVVMLLLDAGADLDAQMGKQGSALQAALERGHQEVAQLLRRAQRSRSRGLTARTILPAAASLW